MGDVTAGRSDREADARRLSAQAIAAGDACGWFEPLYAAAEAGAAIVPWDRQAPARMLVRWAEQTGLNGRGRTALVVGCGLGEDAEYVRSLGFDTTGFDISASAIRAARRRFPRSQVRYVAASLLDSPASWRQAYDLVVECFTLQSMPDPPRRDAIAAVGRFVAPGGTLIAVARSADAAGQADGPPWALHRAEIDALAAPGLRPVRIDEIWDAGPPPARRWLAEFSRPAAPDSPGQVYRAG